MTSENLRGIQLAYKPHAYGDLDWAMLMQVDPGTCLLTSHLTATLKGLLNQTKKYSRKNCTSVLVYKEGIRKTQTPGGTKTRTS